jgi:hypothetical protein
VQACRQTKILDIIQSVTGDIKMKSNSTKILFFIFFMAFLDFAQAESTIFLCKSKEPSKPVSYSYTYGMAEEFYLRIGEGSWAYFFKDTGSWGPNIWNKPPGPAWSNWTSIYSATPRHYVHNINCNDCNKQFSETFDRNTADYIFTSFDQGQVMSVSKYACAPALDPAAEVPPPKY